MQNKYSCQIFRVLFVFQNALTNVWGSLQIFDENLHYIHLHNLYVSLQGYITGTHLVKHKVWGRYHYPGGLMGVGNVVTKGTSALYHFRPREVLQECVDAVSCQRHGNVQFPLIDISSVLTSKAKNCKIQL